MKKFFKNSYLALIIFIIYAPILVVIIFSFNKNDNLQFMSGLSWKWYKYLFKDTPFITSILLSIIIAVSSTLISLFFGTMAVLGLSKTRKVLKNFCFTIGNIPIINSDVVTAVGLMLLFVSLSFPLGIFSLLFAHISFNIPYVILIVYPRCKKIKQNIINASYDLGGKNFYTIRKIILPILKPAIILASIVAFSMSFDDFIISYFCSGSNANVSSFIYSLKRTKPYVNAFTTIFICILMFLIVGFNFYKFFFKKSILNNNLQKIDSKLKKIYLKLRSYYFKINCCKKNKLSYFVITKKIFFYENKIEFYQHKKIKIKHKFLIQDIWWRIKLNILSKNKKLKIWYGFLKRSKIIFFITVLGGLFVLIVSLYINWSTYDISIANWSEYLPISMIKEFEKETHLKVRYTEYSSNEILYNKINFYNNFDIMVPSFYMAKKMKAHHLIQPINFQKINNYFQTNNNNKLTHFDSGQQFFQEVIDQNLLKVFKQTTTLKTREKPKPFYFNYQIPYFWGSLVLLINPNKENKNILQENNFLNSNLVDYNLLIKAKDAGRSILINDDPKNIFLPFSQILYHNTEPESINQIDHIFNKTKQFIIAKNVSLQNDEIVDSIINNDFDFALVYNGDALYSIQAYFQKYHKRLIYKKFHFNNQGSNVWEDGIVISKKSKNLSADYKFINFILAHQIQLATDENSIDYTSPYSFVYPQIFQKNKFLNQYKDLYLPFNKNLEIIKGDQIYWYNQYDKYLVDKYSKILAEKN